MTPGSLWGLFHPDRRSEQLLAGKHPGKAHLAVPSRDNGKQKPDQHRDVRQRVGGCGKRVGLVLWGSIVQLWKSSVLTHSLSLALGSLQGIPAVPITWIFPPLAEL